MLLVKDSGIGQVYNICLYQEHCLIVFNRDHQDLRDHREIQVHRVNQVRTESLDHQDLLDQEEKEVNQENVVHQAHRVRLDVVV